MGRCRWFGPPTRLAQPSRWEIRDGIANHPLVSPIPFAHLARLPRNAPFRASLMNASTVSRALAFSLAAVFLSGCAIIIDNGPDGRDVYVFGYARLRVPNTSATGDHARVIEVTGVGVLVNHYLQLGYFREFQASLKPETNSAVIVLRSEADGARLEALLQKLNQDGLCLIIQDQRS